MRLLSRKIYRAFPELDKFDDAVCKQYVHHARSTGGAWWGRGLIAVVLVVSFILWIGAISLFGYLARNTSIGYALEVVIVLVFFTGLAWFPLLCALLTRDITLRRAIRKRLDATECAACGYNLVGLTVFGDADNRTVQCPECGNRTALNEGHITEADVNPALLFDS